MDFGYVIGWCGIACGFLVAPSQLYRIWRTKDVEAISTVTYVALNLALICYLLHAIYIESVVFMTAQSINLTTNMVILGCLVKYKWMRKND